MNETYERIAQSLAAMPVVDAHSHLEPLDRFENPVTLCEILQRSYVERSFGRPTGSPNGPDGMVPCDESWDGTQAAVARVRYSAFFRWLMAGLADLYGLADDSLTETSFEVLRDEIPRRYLTETWVSDALDRANVVAAIWDPFWRPGTWAAPDPRLKPSLRISSTLAAFHPSNTDADGHNVIGEWGEALDVHVGSLSDLESLVDSLIQRNIEAGCRSFKSPIAYSRTLAVEHVSRSEAERIFGHDPATISEAARLRFGDYMIDWLLDRARDHGLVFQVHTGMARLSGSSPLRLLAVVERHPHVTFDLFHGGYPWIHESGAILQNYPNVRLNMTWLPQLSTEVAVGALKEWIQVAPQVDRITWGADCRTVEESHGATLATRHVVARALSELVRDGYLGESEAEPLGRSILFDAGMEIYGLDIPASPVAP